MDCRAFRKQHLAFVDDTLPGVDVVRMQLHLAECEACEGWDQRVRKSLFVVRNQLGAIEPSAEFRSRLRQRLEAEKAALVSAPPLFGAGRRRFPVWGLVLALGAVGGSAFALLDLSPEPVLVRLPAAVIDATPFVGDAHGQTTPAFMATMSSGMAILPALMIADELPALSEAAPAVRTVGLTIPNPEPREP